MNNQVTLMERSELTKALGSLGKQVASVTKTVQQLVVQAIGYSLVHGDVTIGQRLVESCNKSIRKDSLVKYLENFGAFAYDKVSRKLVHHSRGALKFDTEYVDMLNSNAWNEAKREPELKSKYDVDDMFDSFMARCRKLAATPGVNVVNKELLAVLAHAEKEWFERKLLAETTVAPEAEVVEVEIPTPVAVNA